MSRFNAIMARAEAVLDDHLAEASSILPRSEGELDDGADLSRAAFDCVGLAADFETSAAQIGTMDARVAYAEIEFSIQWNQLPAGFKFRKGDVVKLTERRAPWFKVNRVDSSDAHRVTLTLTEITGT